MNANCSLDHASANRLLSFCPCTPGVFLYYKRNDIGRVLGKKEWEEKDGKIYGARETKSSIPL